MENDILNRAWPEWQIVRQIGRGSFGTVYEAVRKDYQMESRAAIKVISIPQDESERNLLRSEGMDSDEIRTYLLDMTNDFVNEIRLMETFKGIQNIVSVEDYKVVEQTDGPGWDIYIRMELLTPLPVYISDRKMDETEIIRLGCEICTALEICAKRDVIHRDIKPENIFVSDFGYFKLGDFGIARKMENLTTELSQKGTDSYMAPEVEKYLPYDASVDTYSLGLVLYRLMNKNRLPFLDTEKQLLSPGERVAANWRRLEGEALPAPCDATPELARIILRACAYDPADRYGSATEMKQALRQITGDSLPELSQSGSETDGSPKNIGRKRIGVFAAVTAVLVIVFVAFMGSRNTVSRDDMSAADESVSADSEQEITETEEDISITEDTDVQEESDDLTSDEDNAPDGISEESVQEALSLFKNMAYCMLQDNYYESANFPFQVVYYGTISKQNALKLAAAAIAETEYSAMEDPEICYYYNGQIISDRQEISQIQTTPGSYVEMFSVPEGTYEKYMADLFGITETLSDVVAVYDDQSYYYPQFALDEETNEVMILYDETYSQNAPWAVQWGENQFYITTCEFNCDTDVTIESISESPDEDGRYTVVAGYCWQESADEGEEPIIYYMKYSVEPSASSSYGCAIVGMEPAGNSQDN